MEFYYFFLSFFSFWRKCIIFRNYINIEVEDRQILSFPAVRCKIVDNSYCSFNRQTNADYSMSGGETQKISTDFHFNGRIIAAHR